MNLAMPPQPELRVESGSFSRLYSLLRGNAYSRPVLVTGGKSIRNRHEWSAVLDELQQHDMAFAEFTVQGEPSPESVNSTIHDVQRNMPDADVVVAVGGGSVIDAAKAVAAGLGMVRTAAKTPSENTSAFDITRYLEGIGDLQPDGTSLPLIAFPSTAGTGSEATSNAVLSSIGSHGFKKSLRHTGFVPKLAVLDPELQLHCPLTVTRASGLDALTQLLEAYTSSKANPMSDALAECGLSYAGRALPDLLEGADSRELRREMAMAAYLSGVCLAAVGLGLVHGYASPIGALRSIPHGVVCGMLLGPVTRETLAAGPRDHGVSRAKYDRAATLLGIGSTGEELVRQVNVWAKPLGKLGDYGFSSEDVPGIVAGTGLKNHPVKLENGVLHGTLEEIL